MNVIGHQTCHRRTDLRLFLDYIAEVEEGSENEAGDFTAERRVRTEFKLCDTRPLRNQTPPWSPGVSYLLRLVFREWNHFSDPSVL